MKGKIYVKLKNSVTFFLNLYTSILKELPPACNFYSPKVELAVVEPTVHSTQSDPVYYDLILMINRDYAKLF